MVGSPTRQDRDRVLLSTDNRSALLIAISVGFVSTVTVAAHELGHWLADTARGASVRMVVPLFGDPRIETVAPTQVDLNGWPDAAGPLLNIAVGVTLFGALWLWRRPVLLPLLLWGPVALLQESITALVQLATGEAGTDWVRLTAQGVPPWLVVAGALLGGLLAVGGLLLLLPVAGLHTGRPPARRLAVLVAGFTTYAAVSLLAGMAGVGSVARSSRLLLLGLIVALLLSVLYRGRLAVRLAHLTGTAQVGSSSIATVFAATVVVVATVSLVFA